MQELCANLIIVNVWPDNGPYIFTGHQRLARDVKCGAEDFNVQVSLGSLGDRIRRCGSTVRLFAGALSVALIFMLTPCCEVMGAGTPQFEFADTADADHAHPDHHHDSDVPDDAHGLVGHGSCGLRLAVTDDLPGVIPAALASGSFSPSPSYPATPAILASAFPLLYLLASVRRWRAQAPPRVTLPLYLRFVRLRD